MCAFNLTQVDHHSHLNFKNKNDYAAVRYCAKIDVVVVETDPQQTFCLNTLTS